MARRAASPRDAVAALSGQDVAVIAEVKRASPSKGKMASIADPAALACEYEAGGGRVISVLPKPPPFCGTLEHLATIRPRAAVAPLPPGFVVSSYPLPGAPAR